MRIDMQLGVIKKLNDVSVDLALTGLKPVYKIHSEEQKCTKDIGTFP